MVTVTNHAARQHVEYIRDSLFPANDSMKQLAYKGLRSPWARPYSGWTSWLPSHVPLPYDALKAAVGYLGGTTNE